MRVVITGIAGFAGVYLAEHLIEMNDQVLGTSRNGKWKSHALVPPKKRVPLVTWDIAEGLPATVTRSMQEFAPDCIYHLAAISVPSLCGDKQPTATAWATNVQGTARVLELAGSLKPRPRVVLASTSHVYAPEAAEQDCVPEDFPLQPVSAYGQTKLEAERLLQETIQSDKLDGVIARTFKHSGPGQQPPLMLPEWYVQITDGTDQPIRVHSLESFFDVSDVRDVVRAYRLLATRGHCSLAYNVGSGIRRQSRQLLNELLKICGSERLVVEVFPGIRKQAVADITRLHAHTGWTARIPMQQTLRDTLAYWQSLQR